MLKIQPYYRTNEDLEKANEPYKSVANIIDKLYLKGPKDKKALSYHSFKNTKAVSCIRYIAETLAKSQVSFVCRMKTFWSSLLNPNRQFSDSFDNYSVPYEYYQGVIFGGVYFVLAKLKNVDDEYLTMMETFVSNYSEAQPYFTVFKNELIDDNRPLTPRPSTNIVSKTTDIKTLRKQFIQGLNDNFVQIDAIDWADATLGFDRDVMKELFWGVEDDKLLKTIIKAIIKTWNKLVKAKDNRCMINAQETAPVAIAASMDPWKFGGLTRETINKFFDDLWVERNARNTYATFGLEEKVLKPKNEPASKIDIDSTNIEEDKHETGNWNNDTELLQKELAKVTAERDKLADELKAYMDRNQNRRGINRLKTAHLGIKLAPKLGIEYTNKKELAPMLSKLFGWGRNALEKQMSQLISNEEELELADIFGELSPELAKYICKNWEGTPSQKDEAPQTE